MKNYALQPNESILYSGNVFLGTGSASVKLALTNLNLVLVITTKKLFAKEQVQVDVYPVSEIKIYNDVPQIKQKEHRVEVFFTSGEVAVSFLSAREAHKFVNAAWQLITGKSMAERGSDKVKAMVGLVDNALGINTVETIKSTLENGLVGTIFGGIGKKGSSAKGGASSSTTEVVVKEAASLAREVIHSRTPNETTPSEAQAPAISAPAQNDPVEQLKKLKELVDMGILTQEEFDAKKKQILGL